jgi:NAD(P)-dependent dehydrogenase (short-subunit alcohol dehydrogenase family)
MLDDLVRPKFARPAVEPGALAGRVAVVTGASSGIGLAVTRALARGGARVVLACRSVDRGHAAKQELEREVTGATLEIEPLDLSTISSVRLAARALAARHPAIDILVNNGGMWSYYRRESADGVELTWATNQLGPFALTALLAPQLHAAKHARVVNVASGMAHSLDLEDVEFRRRPYVGLNAYAQSKQANRMWTRALARRFASAGTIVNAMHPGFVNTGQFARGGSYQSTIASLVGRLVGRPPDIGADSAVWLAASPEVEGTSGRLVRNRKDMTEQYTDEAAEERLYALCASMTGIADQTRRVTLGVA